MSEQSPAVVLNVNDDEAARYTVSRVLRYAGFQLLEAGTGEEALRLAAARKPDIIILDVQLPDINGIEVCRMLKASPETSSIPVLHTSATFVSAERKVRGLDSGADAYLTQPAEPIELTATVRALLRTRKAEEAARTAAREWLATFDAISDAVLMVDDQGRIMRSNLAAHAMFGRSTGGMIGRSFREAVWDEIGPIDLGSLLSSHEDCARAALEREVAGRWLRLTADPMFDAEGRCVSWVVIIADITPTKRLEEELRSRAEELAEADRRKDEFLAMLAHELRNPLGAITTSVHLQDELGPRDERSVKLRETIKRQAGHLARFIDDLLDISRITWGKIELRKKPIDLVQAIQQSIAASHPAVEAHRLKLVTRLPGEPVFIHADPSRIEQIIANLVGNAAKYNVPGGQIEIELAKHLEGGEGVAELRVTDTGIGMDPESLKSIFELFYQVDQSLARGRGGLGIGLTVVRRLIELHGGTVSASSDGLGKGSQIVVRLPLVKHEAVPAAAEERRSRRSSAGLDVLVVEDNLDACEVLRDLLEAWGYRVKVANDGTKGLEMALETRPDVALVDIGLSGMNGYEIAQRLRASPEGRGVHLVAMTGYGRPEDRARALHAGFDIHLVKPVDPEALSRVLASRRKHIEEEESRSPAN